jgi:hypothetical protein
MDTFLKIPDRIAKLPKDKKGRPVPFFVEWFDDGPDFRIMNPESLIRCIKEKLCWICGEPLGKHMAFVIGPMCGINRTSAEPPSHFSCAHFAVQACPFMTTPRMTRREGGMPEAGDIRAPGGIALMRNPGVTAIWVTKAYAIINDGMGGIVLKMGDPDQIQWWCEGREATRSEIQHSIDTGIPTLMELAEADGPKAVAQLQAAVATFTILLPA